MMHDQQIIKSLCVSQHLSETFLILRRTDPDIIIYIYIYIYIRPLVKYPLFCSDFFNFLDRFLYFSVSAIADMVKSAQKLGYWLKHSKNSFDSCHGKIFVSSSQYRAHTASSQISKREWLSAG
jgi:hypothetical protein